jgi:hypothetical protein
VFQFPAVDPIPLPAPVWLFKLLHIVTLALHFTAVQLLIGGLSLATIWNLFAKGAGAKEASGSIIKKLPTVTTYVINFGVPPLLFAQVLYGRALYTSSVLVGFYWFSVIVVLTLLYYLLYRAADRANAGKPFWGYSIASLVGVIYIGKVFSTNMTLMLRPEDWQALYQTSNGFGNVFPSGDPTTLPRFMFMFVGSLGLAGAAIAVAGAFGNHTEAAKKFLIKWGGSMAVVFAVVQAALGYWVYSVQPAGVQTGLLEHPLFSIGAYAYPALAVVTAVAALAVVFAGEARAKLTTAVTFLFGFLATAMAVLARDGIRDITLSLKGYDVWQRTVVANWSVVLLFLGLFVGGLVLIGVLLVAVSRSAKRVAAAKAEVSVNAEPDAA